MQARRRLDQGLAMSDHREHVKRLRKQVSHLLSDGRVVFRQDDRGSTHAVAHAIGRYSVSIREFLPNS
jgi:hypothetical protein